MPKTTIFYVTSSICLARTVVGVSASFSPQKAEITSCYKKNKLQKTTTTENTHKK
jgi:hypothetical protein